MATICFLTGPLSDQTIDIPLGESRIIGRSTAADITCTDKSLSRRHCIMESGMLGFLITDLDSSNGTWVNGQRISEAALQDGDEIVIGECKMLFSDDTDYAAAETHIQITATRSKMVVARQASMGQQEGYISAKSHFCETCGSHISEEARESGASEKVESVWVCPSCVEEYKELLDAGMLSGIRSYTGFRRKRDLAEKAGEEE